MPKVTVITRKAYGGAYDVMSSKHIRGDVNYAWPDRRDRGDGGQGGGGDHLPRRGQGPGEARPSARPSTRPASPTRSSPPQRGYIDDVIMPHGTRRRIVRALKSLKGKQLSNPWKKHDNIPL